jgi:tetratricopeptide (TPR) repeat protein
MAINPLQDQLEKAVAAHRAGDLAEAEAGYRRILAVSPKHPGTLNLIGVALTQAGRADEGLEFLKRAAKAAPTDDGILFNLGTAELAANRPERAMRAFSDAVRRNPANAGALLNRALLREQRGRFEDAEADYRAAMAAAPTWVKPARALAMLLLARGRPMDALDAADHAVAADPTSPDAGHARGVALIHAGFPEEAVAVLEALVAEAADPVAVGLDLATALIALERREEALALLEDMARRAPTDGAVSHNLAKLYQELARPTDALETINRRLAEAPKDVDALHRRATILEQVNEPERAEADVEAGLAQDPRHAGLAFVAAKLDRRAGRIERAMERLGRAAAASTALPGFNVDVAFENAQCLDALGRHDEAYAAFADANAKAAASIDSRRARARNQDLLDGLRDLADGPNLARLPVSALSDECPDPVFMIGFPRSGTTLLDRVLDAHPDLAVMEEHPILVTLGLSRPGYPTYLPDLTETERRAMRAEYFGQARGDMGQTPARLVDKLPLNILHVPLIRALFPDGPIILSLRHPADVVLSCFMQNFRLNAAMSTFTDLDAAARQYDQVMTLWSRYVEVLGVDAIEVRYEDMVSDLESVARRVLDGLDVPWSDSVLAFRDHLKGRVIATPSYAQVAAPIHSGAVGRWTAYRDHLAPVMPILEPWIDRWGYSAG